MALKDIVKKAGGLFFEDVGGTLNHQADANAGGMPDDLLKQLQQTNAAPMTLTQMNQQMHGASINDVQVNVTPDSLAPAAPATPKAPAAPIVNGDVVDFTPIYVDANLPPVPLTAEGFLKMIQDLGEGIPLPAKRTMVGTMLSTMAKATPGVNSASIANDALLKIKALSVYSEGVKGQLATFTADRQKSIADAEAKIEAEKKAMETAKARVDKLVSWCEKEGNTLDDVLEFFSADTAPNMAGIP